MVLTRIARMPLASSIAMRDYTSTSSKQGRFVSQRAARFLMRQVVRELTCRRYLENGNPFPMQTGLLVQSRSPMPVASMPNLLQSCRQLAA